MIEPNDREMLRLVRGLAARTPDPAATQAALGAARAALDSRSKYSHPVTRRRWIVMTTSGIAAVLGIVLAVSLMVNAPQHASAAERLQEAARTGEAYRGWVHMTFTGPTDKSGVIGKQTTHTNTADGTFVTDTTMPDGKRQVKLWIPSTREEALYDSASNQIKFGTLSEVFAKRWTEEMARWPMTLQGALDQMKQSGRGEPQVEAETREGTLDRYELKITLPATAPTGDETPWPTQMTVWIDRETKLLRKVTCRMWNKPVEMTYAYGEPAIRDIYDLGVPRDAVVVDNRPGKDVEAVLKRLDERYAKGYGPHVAVMTSYSAQIEPNAGEPGGGITLLAQTAMGDALVASYVVGPPVERPRRLTPVPAPAGWPSPTLEATVGALQKASPGEFLVILEGKSGWQGFWDGQKYYVQPLDGQYVQAMPMLLAQKGIAGNVWPTRFGIGLFGADARATVELVKDHPQWIALRIEQSNWNGKGSPNDPANKSRQEQLFVIDPTRDDMPITSHTKGFLPGQDMPQYEWHTEYLEHAQLPGGAWYPKRWLRTTTTHSPTRGDQQSEQMIQLQIFPGEQLPENWFRNYGATTKPH